MRKSIVTVLAAPLLGMLASVATPAAAKEYSVTVSVRDLDLTDAADRATLDQRIAVAVDKVCSAPRRDIRASMAWEECRTLSLADAMEQLAAIESQRNVALAASTEH